MYIGTTKIKFFLTYAHIDYISSIIDVQRKFKREDKGGGEREKKRQKIADRRSRKRIDRSRLEARRCTKDRVRKSRGFGYVKGVRCELSRTCTADLWRRMRI